MRIDKSPIFRNQLQVSSVLLARVTKVFNDPADQDNANIFKRIYPGNSGVGAIEFEFITNINNLSKGYAKPLFPNHKLYPIINEMVYVLSGPTYTTPDNSNDRELYYVSQYNTFNSPHANPQPIINGDGISNSTELNNEYGKTFTLKDNIQSLIAFEGDYILEGRWGNSIRFGSTISGSITQNQWSNESGSGNPITIIRNGQTLNTSSIDFTLEDINNDISSIYMTNGQQLPIDVASKNLDTFNIDLEQVTPNPISIASAEIISDTVYDNVGGEGASTN
jgi:hypothetical protein